MIGPSDTRLAQRKIRLNLSSIPNPLMNLRCLSPTALAKSLSACSWTSTALAASNSFFFILSRIFFVYFIGAPWSLGTISRRSCSVLLSRASSSARKNFVVSAKDVHLASCLSYDQTRVGGTPKFSGNCSGGRGTDGVYHYCKSPESYGAVENLCSACAVYPQENEVLSEIWC